MNTLSRDAGASSSDDGRIAAAGRELRIQVLLNAFVLDGPGRLAAGLAREWTRQWGVRVRVAALSRGGPLRDSLAKMDVPQEQVGAKGKWMWPRTRRWAKNTRANFRPHILHTHLARADFLGPAAGRLLGSPAIISTNHGVHAWREKGRLIELAYRIGYRWSCARMSRIVAVSRATADDLEKAGAPPGRIQVIPNGVDTEEFRPISLAQKRELRVAFGLENPEAPLLLMAGNLIALKGQEYALRAMPEILERHPSAHLLLVGQGPLDDPLRALAAQLGIEKSFKRVNLLSVIFPKLLAASDILLHPSLIESFGLVVAEAQSCGVPVVASRLGGPAEIIRDGETGFLVPPCDPGAIAQAAGTLLSNMELPIQMGVSGRQRVLQLYDIRRCAADYLELFRKLAPVFPPHEPSART